MTLIRKMVGVGAVVAIASMLFASVASAQPANPMQVFGVTGEGDVEEGSEVEAMIDGESVGSATATADGWVIDIQNGTNGDEVSFTASAKYAWAMGGFDASIQAGAAFTDDVFKDANNDPVIAAESHWLYDARATLGPSDGPWELAVWGKNLSDEQYVVQGLNVGSLGFGNRTFNAPRTYGATLSMKWR